jgi:hypothetical protein
MSSGTKEKLFNLRLSPEDRALLGHVAQHLERDQSATIRLLIRRAALTCLPISREGCFTSLPTTECPQSVQFPIRLRGGNDAR